MRFTRQQPRFDIFNIPSLFFCVTNALEIPAMLRRQEEGTRLKYRETAVVVRTLLKQATPRKERSLVLLLHASRTLSTSHSLMFVTNASETAAYRDFNVRSSERG